MIYDLSMICISILIGFDIAVLYFKYEVRSLKDLKKALTSILSDILTAFKDLAIFLKQHKYIFYFLWESAKRFFVFIKRQCNGEDVLEALPNYAYLLTEDEILELCRRFNGYYDTPTLYSYNNNNGVSWYDIRALRLTAKYCDLSTKELFKLFQYIIDNYMMETRKVKAEIYIFVASPTRLYFAIPLSEYGRKFLLESTLKSVSNETKEAPPILEEEVFFTLEDNDV